MSPDQLKPYIGVTGPTRPNEAELLKRLFSQSLTSESSHQGMVGYLVSNRTLNGGTEGRSRYPQIQDIPALLKITQDSSIVNMIHYRTTAPNTLADQVTQLFNYQNMYADKLCQALQLNMRWPDITQLGAIKDQMPDLKIVLALTPGILSTDGDPNQRRINIQHRLRMYGDLMDYILIDFSGGQGKPFPANEAGAFYRAIDRRFFHQPVIIAGGFDALNTSPRLEELSRTLGTKSWGIDAEGGLRFPRDNDRISQLDIVSTHQYLTNCLEFFKTPYQSVIDLNKED